MVDRLDDEVEGAGPHGADHRVDRAARGLDDHRQGFAALGQAFEHRHAVEVGHDQVENHQLEVAARGGQHGKTGLAAVGGDRLVTEALDGLLKEAALNRIVVDDQDASGHGLVRPSASVPIRGTVPG